MEKSQSYIFKIIKSRHQTHSLTQADTLVLCPVTVLVVCHLIFYKNLCCHHKAFLKVKSVCKILIAVAIFVFFFFLRI